MKRAYIIIGMKRSGHHAIVHWIGYNTEPSMHFNDYKISGRELLPAQPPTKPVLFGTEEPTTHIYNFEDFNIDNLERLLSLPCWKSFGEINVCLVLRDPFNWIASCWKCGGGLAKRIKARIQLYKKQAHYFKFPKFGVIPIVYNKWVTEESYRVQVATLLNLDSCDKGVTVLSERGGGSSFDGKKYKHNAHQMELMKRWEVYKRDPVYLSLIDYDLCRISANIFKFNPGLTSNEKNSSN